MPDNVYQQNVYSHKESMWHRKGTVGQNDETCVQVYARMIQVEFEKREFEIKLNGKKVGSKQFAIIRKNGNGDEKIIGTTKDQYNLTQPLEYCQIYDEAVGKPCETLGFLGTDGEKMFITSKLPSISVYGDKINLFQFLAVGFDGFYGEHQYVAAERVICWNTWNRAIADANSTNNHGRGQLYSGTHNSIDHIEKLKSWLSYVQKQAEEYVNITQNLFCKLETAPMTVDEAFGLTKIVYPDPEQLPDFYPDNLRENKQLVIDKKVEKTNESRDLVMDFFKGNGIAISQTGYGFFNSVTEAENHHNPSKKDSTYSILLGNKHNTMDTALVAVTNWVENK